MAAIFSIALGAIGGMVGLYVKIIKWMENINTNMEHQTKELIELKGYREDIDRNTEDIIRLQTQKAEQKEVSEIQQILSGLCAEHKIMHGRE